MQVRRKPSKLKKKHVTYSDKVENAGKEIPLTRHPQGMTQDYAKASVRGCDYEWDSVLDVWSKHNASPGPFRTGPISIGRGKKPWSVLGSWERTGGQDAAVVGLSPAEPLGSHILAVA